jgi:hypothetical protein
MKTKNSIFYFLIALVFYQLDYRERFETELSIPGLAGFSVKKSFETRYRPNKDSLKSINKLNSNKVKDKDRKH